MVVVLTFCVQMKFLSVTIHMKATEQYFPVVLFIMLYKVVLSFDSVDKILKCWGRSRFYVRGGLGNRQPKAGASRGFWGHAPAGNFEIYPLGNAMSSILRAYLSCF